jgi:hypothetical protein
MLHRSSVTIMNPNFVLYFEFVMSFKVFPKGTFALVLLPFCAVIVLPAGHEMVIQKMVLLFSKHIHKYPVHYKMLMLKSSCLHLPR